MTLVFAILLVLHGLIHLVGFFKAFRLAELPQLTQPVSPVLGGVWLIAAALFLVAAVCLFVWPRGWWIIAGCAIVLSTVAIVPSWADAKFGMIANVVVLVGVVVGFSNHGPFSLRAAYEGDVRQGIARFAHVDPVGESDIQHLPPPVQRYLRAAGVIGQPRVRNFRVRMRGRIRSGREAPWMPFTAEQYNFVDEPARFFYMNASMFRIPVQGYHRYVGPTATMTVKAAGLVPVVRAAGDEMNQAETVTLFNDMCVMAPATLIESAIAWGAVDETRARASFTNAGHTIRAELFFNGAGELTDFSSDDRYQTASDGTVRKLRWSTPLREYQSFGPARLASAGEARWHEADGEYPYIELTIDDVRYNLAGAM